MTIGPDFRERIEAAAGKSIQSSAPLSGGCVGDVRRIEFGDGFSLVGKFGGPGSGLALEGRMLRYLGDQTTLPVPDVFIADDDLLLMTNVPSGDPLDDAAESHAADLIAALHDIRGPHFGFAYDTVIGGLPQTNTAGSSWIAFFRDHRLLNMADQALDAGRLALGTRHRIERLAGRLDSWIDGPVSPGLVHGDLWSGNILCRRGQITGFVDPALYFGDPEIELAFSTLFHTFGETFFSRYQEHRPIAPGFFETRRDLYNLYPLLVHVRLFGGTYEQAVERILEQFGC